MNNSQIYDLDRFVRAQSQDSCGYADALAEMKAGRKESHWVWYIFPQLRQLGHSTNAVYFGIENLEEAQLYLAHPVLGERLREITEVVLASPVTEPDVLMGWNVDSKKLHSCMTLFDRASGTADNVFRQVLDKYFAGQGCPLTLDLL